MKYLILLPLFLSFTVSATAQIVAPLSISVESFQYPYPVNFFPLYIEGRHLQMAYMDARPASSNNGKTIVLLHGKNFSSYYWKKTMEALLQKGYRVIAIDQIGFGKSSKADIHYSLHLLAYNTHLLLDSLQVHDPVLIGHSTGGMIAMRYAIMYPDQVSALVLEDPIGLEDYRRLVPYATTDSLFHEELATTDEATTKYIKAYFVTWRPEYQIYADVMNGWKRSSEYARMAMAAALTTQMIYEQPVCYELEQIKAPTLIIVGGDDRTVIEKSKVPKELLPTAGLFTQMAEHAAHLIPHGSYTVVPHTGHIAHIESTEEFHSRLFKFLSELK